MCWPQLLELCRMAGHRLRHHSNGRTSPQPSLWLHRRWTPCWVADCRPRPCGGKGPGRSACPGGHSWAARHHANRSAVAACDGPTELAYRPQMACKLTRGPIVDEHDVQHLRCTKTCEAAHYYEQAAVPILGKVIWTTGRSAWVKLGRLGGPDEGLLIGCDLPIQLHLKSLPTARPPLRTTLQAQWRLCPIKSQALG